MLIWTAGIIISLSLAAAVGIALQSPEVKEWLEEQRRKLAELLRTMSEGLDPQTRQEAEAFAFEGRMPTAREREGMQTATAVATGREPEDNATLRRSNRQSTSNPIDAEERRRLGREYLAKRNQELLDIKRKRDSENANGESANITEKEAAMDQEPLAIREKSASIGSFDHLINHDGSLRADEKRISLASDAPTELPAYQPIEEPITAPAAMRGLQAGSHFGNPFGDEFAMSDPMLLDRSETPRPPVPPKIAIGSETSASAHSYDEPMAEDSSEQVPGRSVTPPRVPPQQQDLSYDEQLARALSISLAESEAEQRHSLHRTLTEREALEHAIRESLRETEKPSDSALSPKGPLVDFSSDVAAESSIDRSRQCNEDEDLYTLTPMVTGVQPHVDHEQSLSSQPALPEMPEHFNAFQGVHQKLTQEPRGFSSPAAQPTSPTTATLSPSLPPQDALSTGYHTESETDDFASLPDSTARSEASLIEVEDVDIESMSDDDDGIRTPQSWSEVGSDVGDSERSESEAGDLVHV